ncbi:uncharacterized protein LOC128553385 [Mercenaria mercenaria]|uniref:uncharacterized protein LOC128553385 n=1 Tax=Mercenaria mercenaria TaxID=6596 RepID=UPI00234F3EE2|nr:uncharacterized protein LOC128553385 [Mercenaria mercenaria]
MRELRRTHEALQPTKMFATDPSLGFRDICLQILGILKEGKKIAILDVNELKKTRLSYIKLLQKKCDRMSVAVLSILPKYGCEQLFWTRELRLAAELSLCETEDCSRSEIPLNDARLTKWFSKDSASDIHYKHGIVEKPSELDECTVLEKCVGIYTKSVYKFEVPVIFVQWEVVCGLMTNNHRMSKLLKAFELWTSVNHCGRIIVICDGSQIHTGEKTKAQQQKDIDDAMTCLTNQFTACPVYVYHIVDPKQAGGYMAPPKPGSFAFLQQRHCLNLHSRRSVYMYETSSHMKMAENAGVRHIKASRVIDHPSLVVSSHAAYTPAIPEMLKSKKILPGQTRNNPPTIPLVQLKHTFSEGKIQQNLPYGRSEYMYVTDLENIQRYNDLYVKYATEVGQPGSKMSPKKKCHSTPNKSCTSQINVSDTSADQSRLSIAQRDLPKWMVKKDRSRELRSSGEVSQSDGDLQKEKKIRKTMYVMTEKELVEVACDILKQAGKDDIVERFMSKKDIDSDTNSKNNKKEIKPNLMKNAVERRPYHRERTKSKMDKIEASNDIGDQLGSFCPKMEPESDLEENNMNSSVNTDSDMHVPSEESDFSEALDKKEKNRVVESDVGDIVASVLEDFSTSRVAPKPSPKKRTRIKEEPVFTSVTPSKQRRCDTSNNTRNNLDFKDKRNLQNRSLSVQFEEKHINISDVSPKEDAGKKRKTRHTPDLSHLDDIF